MGKGFKNLHPGETSILQIFKLKMGHLLRVGVKRLLFCELCYCGVADVEIGISGPNLRKGKTK